MRLAVQILLILLLAISLSAVNAQPFTVTGRVMIDSFVVRNASVTFIDVSDTNRRVETRTDSLGNFRVNIPTGVLAPNPATPQSFTLDQNYPNPFSSSTEIPYTLERPSPVEVRIYDLLGKLVKSFQIGTQGAGLFGVRWDGRNESGLRMAHGIYFYQIRAGNGIQTRKMLLMNSQGAAVLSGSPVQAPRTYRRLSRKAGEWTYRVRINNATTTRPKVQVFDTTISLSDGMDLTLRVPESLDSYALCYVRQDTVGRLNWEIYISNLTGTNKKNITNYQGDDEYPAWSPDGRYIAFSRGFSIYTIELQSGVLTKLTSDGAGASQGPAWTPNGQVYFAYHRPSESPVATYVMNPDGSNKKRILDHAAEIIFYQDGYTFLYSDGSRVFKTNIDSSFQEYVFNQDTTLGQFVAIQGFNPQKELLLVSPSAAGNRDAIVEFNITTKDTAIIFLTEPGHVFHQIRYNANWTSLAMVDHCDTMEQLSIGVRGSRRDLLTIPTTFPPVVFSYEPMFFSPENNYLVFCKLVFLPGSALSFKSVCYVVDVITGSIIQTGEGRLPSWNAQW